MTQLVEEILRSRNIHPSEQELTALTRRWQGMQRQRGDLEGIRLGDADIALRSIPGGDHVEF